MVLKELVLNGLESFDSYKIQYSYWQGKVKESTLTEKLYEQLADEPLDHFYLDKDENGKPYISIKMKNWVGGKFLPYGKFMKVKKWKLN